MFDDFYFDLDKWCEKTWFVILMLIFAFPFGIYCLVRSHRHMLFKIAAIACTLWHVLFLMVALSELLKHPLNFFFYFFTGTIPLTLIYMINELICYFREKQKYGHSEPKPLYISGIAVGVAFVLLVASYFDYTPDNINSTESTNFSEVADHSSFRESADALPTEPTPVPTPEPTPEPTPPPTKAPVPVSSTQSNGEKYVYKGETGTKYHREDCRTLKGQKYRITLESALKEGREPCQVCNP